MSSVNYKDSCFDVADIEQSQAIRQEEYGSNNKLEQRAVEIDSSSLDYSKTKKGTVEDFKVAHKKLNYDTLVGGRQNIKDSVDNSFQNNFAANDDSSR